MYIITRARKRRSLWLASTVLIPLSPLAIPAASAQQSASPNLLPSVEVNPAKPVAPPPAAKPKPSRRQAAAKPSAPKPPEQPATPKPGVATPNDTDNYPAPATTVPATAVLSDIEAFANFMRMLAPPTPAQPTASIQSGRAVFANIGCAFCHTPSMSTGIRIASGSWRVPSQALSNKQANLFSDLLVHHMGAGLADGITQGAAGPDEFRTAPLWGLGQRVFFLHDGRTNNLIQAIEDHAGQGSEANQVVANYGALDARQQQDLINFLRSL